VLPALARDARSRHDLDLWLDGSFEELRTFLRSVRFLGEVTGRARDALLAFGEKWSSRLLCAALSHEGVNARVVDPTTVVATDGAHGAATVDLDRTREMCLATLREPLERGLVPVVGGFTGVSPEGRTTTLGRGGGDTSAAVLGSALDAEEIQIWTDVDGLMSADPRVVPEARPLASATFAEAAELAFYGAKVLHPASIEPAVRRRIPVRIRNAGRPERPGTTIVANGAGKSRIASVASRRGVRLLRVVSRTLHADPAFLAAVADGLRRWKVVPDVVVVSEIGAAVAVPDDAGADRIAADLETLGEVETLTGRAVVCVVGAGLAVDPRLRGDAVEALSRLDADVVAVGGSGSAVTAVLPETGLGEGVRSLHRRFFVEGAPP
jgi:aspartate kinase